jgi:ELWxxDGT repeat protein
MPCVNHTSLRHARSTTCVCEAFEPRRLFSSVVLVDSNPGAGSVSGGYLTNFDGRALFYTRNYPQSARLWISDGTAAGTTSIHETPPQMSIYGESGELNGELLFFSRLGIERDGLFITDGTAAGTRKLLELSTNGSDGVSDFVVEGGLAYFGIGQHIWQTDGTPEGTVVAVPAPAKHTAWVRWNGDFYYYGLTEVGLAFFRSDGTEAGTELLRQFSLPGYAYGTAIIPAYGKLYLSVGPGWTDEFWSSDGTAAGTRRVEPMPPTSICYQPHRLALEGDGLRFWAYDRTVYPNYRVLRQWVLPPDHQMAFAPAVPAHEEWGRVEINGNVFSAGSQDLYLNGAVIAPGIQPRNLMNVNGTLAFKASDAAHGEELWTSDGTPAGTRLADDIMPGPQTSLIHPFAVLGNKAIFVAQSPAVGHEFMAYALPSGFAPSRPAPRLGFGLLRPDGMPGAARFDGVGLDFLGDDEAAEGA